MSEADEMYEGIESVIDDMIKEYKEQGVFHPQNTYRCQREIDCLEELKRRLNE